MRSRALPGYCTGGRNIEDLGGIIVHYFSCINVDPENAFNLESCRNLFLDLNRQRRAREFYMRGDVWPAGRMYASAHVLIGRTGEAWRLVEYDKQAYHAGASILNNRSNCNRWTLGVELVGTKDSGFTTEQYRKLAGLIVDLEIPIDMVAGHDKVRWAAIADGSNKGPKYDPSGRKTGQGDNFNWQYLRHLVADYQLHAPVD